MQNISKMLNLSLSEFPFQKSWEKFFAQRMMEIGLSKILGEFFAQRMMEIGPFQKSWEEFFAQRMMEIGFRMKPLQPNAKFNRYKNSHFSK